MDKNLLGLHRICAWLVRYFIAQSMLLGGILIIADRLLYRWICKSVPEFFIFFIPFIGIVLHVLCFVAWAGITLLGILSANYKRKTGRSFIRDYSKYSLPYRELLDFYKDADPYRLDVSTLPVEDWHQADGVILGKVGDRLVKRPSDGEGNLAVFSLPGGGKTTTQIIPTALRFGGSVLAVDVKGDVLKRTQKHRDIKVFAPDKPQESAHYNPMDGIAELSDDDRKLAIEQMAYVLLPDKMDNNGKYFTEGGRDYFCGVALYMLDEDPHTTLPEIAKAIVTGNYVEWARKVDNGPSDIAKSYLSSYIGSNEKNVGGAYGEIVKALRSFSSGSLAQLLDGSGDCITPATLEAGFDVYIEIPQDKISVYAPVTTLIVQQFLTAFMRRPDLATGQKPRPIIFLLDEFPQLSFDFSVLNAALSTLRSKRVSLFLAMQSPAQLNQRYGESGFRTIIDTCPYISIMSAQDPDSREYFSKLCGTQKVLKVSTSAGNNTVSRNIQEDRERVFQPADFGNLGKNVIIVANGQHIKARKTSCLW